jgi:uncharacterized protein (TIGR02996 family)
MCTFHFRDGKSDKFWAIELQGKSLTVTFGRTGTAGQTQKKTFPDAAKAQKEHDKLVADKLARGYVEQAAAAAPEPLQVALEQALAEDPDDLGAHAAFADYLQERGDPRGEFISVQLALEEPGKSAAERKRLQARELALLRKHGRDWLGGLAPYLLRTTRVEGEDFTRWAYYHGFARGWLDTLQVGVLTVPFARVLAAAPETRLLRRLMIEELKVYFDDEEDELDEEDGGGEPFPPGPDVPEEAEQPALYPLLTSPYLGNVRVLQLGDQVDDEEKPPRNGYLCRMPPTCGVDLVRKMPRLEELYWLAHAGRKVLEALFGLPSLDNLRVLQVYHPETDYPLSILARNKSLGRLTHLLLHPHGFTHSASKYGSFLPLAEVKPVLRSPHLKSLTHLRVHCSDLGDEGCREIVKSGILKRLKVLDLRHGGITDEGARTLAACPDLKNLELLDVMANGLTRKGIDALKVTGVRLRADKQLKEAELGRGEYLWEGDCE